jgi:hypothetical protein
MGVIGNEFEERTVPGEGALGGCWESLGRTGGANRQITRFD